MLSDHKSRNRSEEAMRLITLARSMLSAPRDVLAITHLDLAFDAILDTRQAQDASNSFADPAPIGQCG